MSDEIKKKEALENIWNAYKQSNLICNSTPDQYQYRQNLLIQALAEYSLISYLYPKEMEIDK